MNGSARARWAVACCSQCLTDVTRRQLEWPFRKTFHRYELDRVETIRGKRKHAEVSNCIAGAIDI
jgi:hypothetical protein